MNGQQHLPARLRHLALTFAVAAAITGLSFVALQFASSALMVMHGRDGCGAFITALAEAPPGRTLAMMDRIPRDSDSAIVTKTVTIQGGWTHLGGGGCSEENEHFAAGVDQAHANNFYLNPDTRSYLQNVDEPVIRIEHSGILTIENMGFNQNGWAQSGGGIYGVLDSGARLLMRNVEFNESRAYVDGAGLWLEVRGGAHVLIDGGVFTDNEADGNGGGLHIRVYDNSHVTIANAHFEYNVAGGMGGAGHIVIDSGYVTVTNNTFAHNQAAAHAGDDLAIESTGNGPARVWLTNNTFGGAFQPSHQQVLIGDGVVARGNNLFNAYLPLRLQNVAHPLPAAPPVPTPTPTATPTPHARITGITIVNGNYAVAFAADGLTPQLPGVHLHFFFDTVPPEHAGVPGSGPWRLNPGANGQLASNPFTGYRVADRPEGAGQMCVYVANENHSIRLGTGNCYPLP